MIRFSVVIPAYNEVGTVQELYDRVVAVLTQMNEPWEIVYVDDGSHDGTSEALDKLAAADDRVVVIHQPGNFGKSAAYTAAFRRLRGEFVFTLDADLQDEPGEMPNLLAAIRGGSDLVIGWKRGRMQNEPLKRIPSGVFNAMMTRSFGLKLTDSNSGIRGMKRAVADSLVLYGDLYRFIPQLAHTAGFRVTEIPVEHHARKHGVSKYGAKRFWTGALDLLTVRFLTRYRERPLHFFATAGLGPLTIGTLIELMVLASKLAGHTFQEHVAAIIVGVLLILLGFQAIAVGLIAELISGQLQHIRHERDRSGSRLL
jgi:glycosyltransferase involved in cell wall biosynthesis